MKLNLPQTVRHLFVVDTAVITQSSKQQLIAQINDSLESIRNSARKYPNQTHRITLFSLDATGIKCTYNDVSIGDIISFQPKIALKHEVQLLDGVGAALGTWRALNKRSSAMDKYHVSIFTSGRDKGSKKYSMCTLKTIITSLRDSGWQFTMIGANPLLPHVAVHFGIESYYLCKPPYSTRERLFLINQLQRQWIRSQKSHTESIDRHVAA